MKDSEEYHYLFEPIVDFSGGENIKNDAMGYFPAFFNGENKGDYSSSTDSSFDSDQ